MKFDKSKVLTCVTADQVMVGKKGWFGETLSALEKRVEREPPEVLERVLLSGDRRYIFMTNSDSWSLFYPAPEPTYAERQAEWVKENNVKAGTKVRVTRTFTSYEDGCNIPFIPERGTFIGDDCTVDVIRDTCINVRSKQKDDWWSFPYFVLEVVKEPTYEEIQAEWVSKNNVKVGTKVRFTKGFKTAEDGSGCCEHRDAKGMEGIVSYIEEDLLIVRVPSDGWAVPFTALEVIPEESWFKIGDKVRITIKSSEAYNKIGTVTNIHVHRDGTQTVYLSFEEFWDTKAFNADSKEKIGELYTSTYEERQAEWIKKHNLKEGDKVKILRTAKSREDGWRNTWVQPMTDMVGGVFTCVRTSGNGVRLSCGYEWPYFVLEVIKEPTYAERQSEWVKENSVKVGTKVRFMKGFDADEDGSGCCEHRDAKGKEGFVNEIFNTYLSVVLYGDCWTCPFTALEVIKEPTYRPYNNDELNDLVGEVLTNKQSGRKKLVTGKPTASQGVNLDGSYISAKDLLASFYRNTDKPCGVREDK